MQRLTRRKALELLGMAGLTVGAAPLVAGAARAAALAERSKARCRGLCTRLTREYGLLHPIVGAGMGFYALPELVAAISNAGGLGILGAAAEPPFRLRSLIQQTKAMTSGLFGVDFVNTTLFGLGIPAVTDAHIDVCVEQGVKVVVFFWNTPERPWVQRLHESGAKVWMQVGSVEGALEAIDVGADALIAQGSEAGGHVRGAEEGRPVVRSELVPKVIEVAGRRIVLSSGGIADGRGLAAALSEGAEGAWVGTRFAASLESFAHDEYKKRVVAATANDTVVTTMFGPEWPGPKARALRNRVVNEWAGREDEIPTPPPPPPIIGTTLFAGAPYAMPKFSTILPTRDTAGDFEEMWFTAGSVSSGIVKGIKPAAQIVTDMVAEARSLMSV